MGGTDPSNPGADAEGAGSSRATADISEPSGAVAAAPEAVIEAGCGCSSSPELQALSCGPRDGGLPIAGGALEVAAGGDVALFTMCYSRDGQLPSDECLPFRWSRERGSEALARAGHSLGLADDGAALVVESLAGSREELLLVGRDGERTSVPLTSAARLSPDGRYVVDFPSPPAPLVEPGVTIPATFSRGPLTRWSLADGLETLAELPDAMIDGAVFDVSVDASVVVGIAHEASDGIARRAVLYTAEQGLRRVDVLPSGGGETIAVVSRDGSAFAGHTGSSSSGDLSEAFYWTAAGGVRTVTLANPLGGVAFLQALSDDGLVLAGTGWLPDVARHRVYRWTAEGLAWLGPEDAASRLADMTADGSLVLGTLIDADQGFLAAPGETRRLNDLLEQASFDSSGWELKAPLRITDDGAVVFGRALCGGLPTVYRWVLPE